MLRHPDRLHLVGHAVLPERRTPHVINASVKTDRTNGKLYARFQENYPVARTLTWPVVVDRPPGDLVVLDDRDHPGTPVQQRVQMKPAYAACALIAEIRPITRWA